MQLNFCYICIIFSIILQFLPSSFSIASIFQASTDRYFSTVNYKSYKNVPYSHYNNPSKIIKKRKYHNGHHYYKNAPYFENMQTGAVPMYMQPFSSPRPQLSLRPSTRPSAPYLRYKAKQDSTENSNLKKCDGVENFFHDLGIISYVLGVIGAILGTIDVVFSVIGQLLSAESTILSYLTSLPSAVVTLSGKSDFITYLFANFLSLWSVIATVESHLGLPFGDASIYIGVVGEGLGWISVILGTLATFPVILREPFEKFLSTKHVEYQNFVYNYGCEN